MMCDGVVDNSAERKCFKQTLIIIDKSIDKGNEIIENIIKKLKDDQQTKNIRKY